MKERGPGLAFTAANPLSVGIHSAPNTRIINCFRAGRPQHTAGESPVTSSQGPASRVNSLNPEPLIQNPTL